MTAPRRAAHAQRTSGWLDRLARIAPRSAAIAGFVMALPIGLLLLVAAFQLEPLGTWLRSVLTVDGIQPSALGRVYMVGSLLLLPIAVVVAALPTLRRALGGRRHIYAVNVAVVAFVTLLIVLTWGALAEEVVRCDVMGIPNCD